MTYHEHIAAQLAALAPWCSEAMLPGGGSYLARVTHDGRGWGWSVEAHPRNLADYAAACARLGVDGARSIARRSVAHDMGIALGLSRVYRPAVGSAA